MNLKWCGRKWPWPISRDCPGIQLEGWRKATKTSVRIVDVLDKI
jgi:hypothetical protein